MTLLDILIAAIILIVVLYVAKLILDMLELDAPLRKIVFLIIALVVIVIVLSWFGVGEGFLNRRVTD